MTAPPPVGAATAVICHTCRINVYSGDTPPVDGQALLSAWTLKTPGTVCPSGVDPCPNKPAAVSAAAKQHIQLILARIAAIEAKLNITPPALGEPNG